MAGFLATDAGKQLVTQVAGSALPLIARTAREWLREQRKSKLFDEVHKDFRKPGKPAKRHARSPMIEDINSANDENEKKRKLQKLQQQIDELLRAPERRTPPYRNRQRRKGG